MHERGKKKLVSNAHTRRGPELSAQTDRADSRREPDSANWLVYI